MKVEKPSQLALVFNYFLTIVIFRQVAADNLSDFSNVLLEDADSVGIDEIENSISIGEDSIIFNG